MPQSLSDLGAVCVDGPYTVDISTYTDCAGGGVLTNINISGSFVIDNNSVSMNPGGGSTTEANAGDTVVVTVTFGGTNGSLAYRVFNRHANFLLVTTSEPPPPDLEISDGPVSSTTISWRISNGTAIGNVPFEITSISAFNTWTGWTLSDVLGENTFNINWSKK